MQQRQYDVITISREFGAGGSELAQALGMRLGWRVVDRGLVRDVAGRLGVDEDAIEARDEHAPGLLERIGTTLLRTAPEVLVVPPDLSSPLPETIADTVRAVCTEAAESPPVILVGHGTQALLAGRPRTLHLRLVAPLATRIARIRARTGDDTATATAAARRVDADRASYIRRSYGCDWRDPLLYTLQLNTGRVDVEAAAHLVIALVEGHRG